MKLSCILVLPPPTSLMLYYCVTKKYGTFLHPCFATQLSLSLSSFSCLLPSLWSLRWNFRPPFQVTARPFSDPIRSKDFRVLNLTAILVPLKKSKNSKQFWCQGIPKPLCMSLSHILLHKRSLTKKQGNWFRDVSRRKWHALRSEPTLHFNQLCLIPILVSILIQGKSVMFLRHCEKMYLLPPVSATRTLLACLS